MSITLDEVAASDEPTDLPIVRWLRVVRRRWRVVALAVLAGMLAAALVTVLESKSYSATAELFFREDALSQAANGQFVQATPIVAQDATTVAATNLRLLTLPVVAQRAAALLRRPYTGQMVKTKISVAPQGQSDVLGVTASDARPTEAARIANAYANGFLAERRQADRAALIHTVDTLKREIGALPPAQRAGPRGQLLSSREQDLTILASLQTGGAELAQSATVPSHTSSPNPARNLVLGLFAGLVLAALATVAREQLDRRIRDPSEAKALFRRPLLGVVPRLEPSTAGSADQIQDSVRLILAHLRYFNTSEEIKVVMVTSAESDDGKTTLAWSLAHAAASSGRKTVLVEADLRRPALGSRHRLVTPQSLSDVLAGLAVWQDAICKVSLNGNIRDSASLDVLMAGHVLNPDDLIGSDRLPVLLKALRAAYDFVVIDTAPPTMVAESLPLVLASDGIIAVVRANKSVRITNELLRDQLKEMNGRLLGVVVNDVPTSHLKYGYGYAS
jgi:tyrosine-protein kinase